MKLEMVTFTGADARTDVKSLENFSKENPWIEWGILTSAHTFGDRPRELFPNARWVDRFLETDTTRCLHVCGDWCRQLLGGDDTFLKAYGPERLEAFARIQLNFHNRDESYLNAEAFLSIIDRHGLLGKEWIVPVGAENLPAIRLMSRMGLKMRVLFDDSAGAGLTPSHWQPPLADVPCGYAGGMGPHNLAQEVSRISQVTPAGYATWIDMENRLRSGAEWIFDLDKVSTCIEQVSKAVCVEKKAV